MARTGRPKAKLELTDDEREMLLRYTRRATSSQRLAQRARIVLRCADGVPNRQVAEELGVHEATVGKWRKRFVEARLDGLCDDDRPGPNRQIGDDDVEAIIVATLETKPEGATHWSTRSMAKKMGLSHSSIGRIWRTFGLKPHLSSETFQLSTDPHFVEKVRDVVGLYMNPPDNALVLCTDEKSQIQALNRTQPILPLAPGAAERGTPEYERNGTITLFAALDVATGNVITKTFKRHRAIEYKKFLEHVDRSTDRSLDLHLIVDNYATHKTPMIKRWLARHPRFHQHFIPTHSSWLNMVEGWFGILTTKQIKRGSHNSVPELKAAIQEFVDAHHDDPTPFKWTKTADEILAKVAGVCARVLNAHTDVLVEN